MSDVEFQLKKKDDKKILFIILNSKNINFSEESINKYIQTYKEYLENNKMSIIIDSRNLETINPKIIWENLPKAMQFSILVEMNVYCTVLITSFKMVYSLAESIAKVYPNSRPYKVVKNNKDAFDFVAKCNKD